MKKSDLSQRGFTLIELLVAVTIVSVLSAIALPQYKAYRQRAYDTVALSDVRSVALAEENYMLDNQKYFSCENTSCTELPGIIRLSKGVSLKVVTNNDDFIVQAKHQLGSKTVKWDSSAGGIVE